MGVRRGAKRHRRNVLFRVRTTSMKGDVKRDLHNINLGFIQLKGNVHFDSTDHDCPKEPPRSE